MKKKEIINKLQQDLTLIQFSKLSAEMLYFIATRCAAPKATWQYDEVKEMLQKGEYYSFVHTGKLSFMQGNNAKGMLIFLRISDKEKDPIEKMHEVCEEATEFINYDASILWASEITQVPEVEAELLVVK